VKTAPVPEVMNTEEAARYLGMSTQWLEVSRVKGTGPRFCRLGRAIRYRREALDEWLIAHEVSNTAQRDTRE